MGKLFELKKKVTATEIVFARALFIQYLQILLMKNFRQFLEKIMLSSKVLHMGMQKTPYQKTWELQVDAQELDVDFKRCERQFDWLKISLVYDKSDKHTTIYDSYNAVCAARMVKKIELSNISNAYSATNTMKFDIKNDTQNICSGNNILPGIATAIQTLPFWITSMTLCFRSFYQKTRIWQIPLMKEFI